MTTAIPVLSDTQIPHHDRRAMSAFCNMLADRQSLFSSLFQIGDLFNFDAVSRWNDGTPRESGADLAKELKSGERMLGDIGAAFTGPKAYVMGNHDDRLANYLDKKAHGLVGVVEFEALTKVKQYGWEQMPQPYRITRDTVAVHGMFVRSRSGYTAHAHLDRFDCNVIHGHTHRAGIVFRTNNARTRWGMEVGHMMSEAKATYTMVPDWQKGFGVLWLDSTGTVPEFVPVRRDGSFFFDGKRWLP